MIIYSKNYDALIWSVVSAVEMGGEMKILKLTTKVFIKSILRFAICDQTTLRFCTALYCTSLHSTDLLCVARHCTALHFSTLLLQWRSSSSLAQLRAVQWRAMQRRIVLWRAMQWRPRGCVSVK